MPLAHLLTRQARLSPTRPTVFNGETLWSTHAQWAARSAALARHLRASGLAPGDRIVLFMRNHPRYLEVLWAAWWAGLVVVPVNAKLHPNEVAWIIGDAQARWAFVTRDVAPNALPGLARQVDVESAEADALLASQSDDDSGWSAVPITDRRPDDLAWLFYTSGTTGRPKGVMLTHRNLMTMGLGYFADVDAVSPDDAMVYAAPMSHGCGLYAIPHLMAGARHVVPASGSLDPAELFALGRALGPLSTFAAPTIVKRLVDHAESQGLAPEGAAAAFKTIVFGGVQIHGQGETPMVTTVLSRRQITAATTRARWKRCC